MKYKVALVDDHVLIAKALTGIIEKFDRFEVLYEVENGKQLVDKLQHPQHIPDIVLLDVNMPVMDGYETAAWLKDHHPDINILALSVQEEEETLIRIIRSGAQGYLLKNVRPAELEKALEAIIERGFYYPDWVAHKVIRSITSGDTEPEIVLNKREMEFLQYAATDLTYKEIADKMCCSPRTVEGYRDSLFEKFQLKSRVSLVVYALRKKLIDL